jgi:hypothetical protein
MKIKPPKQEAWEISPAWQALLGSKFYLQLSLETGL